MEKQILQQVTGASSKTVSLISAAAISLVIFLDQLSKYFISHSFYLGETFRIFSWLNFSFQQNQGAAFSFLSHSNGWQIYLLIAIAILVCFGMILWLWSQSKQNKWQALAIGLIVGGAIGNLIDRLRFGYVIDFIDFHLGNWHYATFNIADSAITIGVGILVIVLLFVPKQR